MSDPRKSDKLPHPQKVKDLTIGREPNSAVVFHALPKHDYTVDPSEVPDDRQKWQDKEHRVHLNNDKKGIVGHLQKDWEESTTSDQKTVATRDVSDELSDPQKDECDELPDTQKGERDELPDPQKDKNDKLPDPQKDKNDELPDPQKDELSDLQKDECDDPQKDESDEQPNLQKVNNFIIGREPNSSVVFHALPRHYNIVDPREIPDDRQKWQDQEHRVYVGGDKKGIVGHLQKDWEESTTSDQKNVTTRDISGETPGLQADESDELPDIQKDENNKLPCQQKNESDELPDPQKDESDELPGPQEDESDELPDPQKDESGKLLDPQKDANDELPNPQKDESDELLDPRKIKNFTIGREPNSSVVFHARPRSYYIVDPREIPDDRQKWQDQEHRDMLVVTKKVCIVGHLQKDWENSVTSDQKNVTTRDVSDELPDSQKDESDELPGPQKDESDSDELPDLQKDESDSDEQLDPQKVNHFSIGREPNSSVVFHALPKHYNIVDPREVPDDRQKWQDQEHRVHFGGDKKGIVGHLQKDWEESATSDKKMLTEKDKKKPTNNKVLGNIDN
ncbi:spermatogenesis-associated protein 31D1 [Gigaspora margarita]|uniref:Spermatogenesis-associated protein 31D1 n=1 Tax=Gigaspora margarita TaxID=4874 RepID=A0A8H4ANH8_GIGMA|nr:spermatogenesis-associated protein 31D1 [Gigaspora margarita]